VWGIVPHDQERGVEATWNGPPERVRAP
jgi:hypothetical protein